MNEWDQPGDDGVLDDADTLASDDMTRDRLDSGIEPPDAYTAGQGWGDTETEARQGEPLDQLLPEEEPELADSSPATTGAAATSPDPETGQLIADNASADTATQLPTAVPGTERSAEQTASTSRRPPHEHLHTASLHRPTPTCADQRSSVIGPDHSGANRRRCRRADQARQWQPSRPRAATAMTPVPRPA